MSFFPPFCTQFFELLEVSFQVYFKLQEQKREEAKKRLDDDLDDYWKPKMKGNPLFTYFSSLFGRG